MGRDQHDRLCSTQPHNFNPHARVGRDALRAEQAKGLQYFNPHARVGRDSGKYRRLSFRQNFNPHARVGRDQRFNKIMDEHYTFQSTRPRGA